MVAVLEGVRVIDLGRFIAGPFAASILGDLGADVIRIVPPGGGDDDRLIPVGPNDEGANFLQFGRNKRSLELDLGNAEGKAILRKLITTADVIVANMPPASLKSLGIDYESAAALKPDIIVAASSGFSTKGPYADRVGFDAIGQAMSGVVRFSGTEDSPMRAQAPFCDYGTAIALALGVLAALIERGKSGKGQLVEASLLHTGVTFMGQWLLEEKLVSPGRRPIGNRSFTSAPADLYKTQDGWIMTYVIGAQFKRWANMIGEPDWVGRAGYENDMLRAANGGPINDRMSAWCAQRTTAEVLDALERARIPGGSAYTLAEVNADPHVDSESFTKPLPYPGIGEVRLVKPIIELSRTPATVRTPPAPIGTHTREILAELGVDPEVTA